MARKGEGPNNSLSQNLFGILAIAMAGAMFVSKRPFLPQDRPRIETIAVLPDDAKMAEVRRYTEIGSGILPYTEREQAKRQMLGWPDHQPLKLGYSYREVSFLRMPFWAYQEYGLVTFIETPAGFQLALLSPAQVAMIEEWGGKSYSSGYSWRLARHLWGWLFLIGFVGTAILYLREHAKWRREQGII